MLQLRRLLMVRTSSSSLQQFSTKAAREPKAKSEPKLFPVKMLNKKHKTPPYMYLANAQAAQLIDEHIEPFLKQSTCDTALELNPGIGLLTEKLLARTDRFRKIILVETLEHFLPELNKLELQQPERVKVQLGDMVSLWKLVYQDKMDNGSRVAEMLHEVPKRGHDEDPNIMMFGAVGAYNFFKHLINSLVFQNSLLSVGRCEMYLAVPPPIYIHLTCMKDIGYMLYRSTSMLFQMLFEYRFIAKLPREHFLPTQSDYNLTKSSKLGRVKSINPDFLYLVKIVPRRNIYELCPAVDLPALWYFVKQNCISRRNRVIPNLEKWVPGCGPRLIINSEPSEPSQFVYPDEDPLKLPKYSTRCTTMSTRDYFPNMNIYTQFGDLSASQMLTLFTQFRHWSEYSQSSFLASLENSMIKMEASADESIDGIGLAEEDDVSSEVLSVDDAPTMDEVTQSVTPTTTPQRKKKAKTNV